MNNTKTVTRILKLIIPLTPSSLNKWQRAHWAKRRRIQDEWDNQVAVGLAKTTNLVRLRPLMEKARIEIKYFFRTKHKRDKDNYTPKVIMDCLKGRVIVDDSNDRVDLDWELLYDRKAPRTEIMVEELN